MEDHLRTMLIWPRAESDICVLVIAIDLVRFPCSWTWPTSMRLEIWEGGLGTLDIQSTNFKGNTPMAQIKCAPGMGNPEFEALFGSLRRVGGFAVAQHDVYDECRRLRLLCAPLGNVLLCAVLPSSRIEEFRDLRRQSRNGATCSRKEPVEPGRHVRSEGCDLATTSTALAATSLRRRHTAPAAAVD
ncbi:hypothetical protein F5148DRAFT_523211 [Russula earlei]|uniref:Uncharacterized protein n=1 Tax=Russula earlei TaxID=71964 RepID=A0ACC0UG63_9AGAM|nr:hypothetical protein F5148DRAFT_523211 [Russula earlei]